MSSAATSPLVKAALMTCCCDGPLGACAPPPTLPVSAREPVHHARDSLQQAAVNLIWHEQHPP